MSIVALEGQCLHRLQIEDEAQVAPAHPSGDLVAAQALIASQVNC
ncbi:hypothetical protein IMCC3135_03125 [Granulosicoccus antarcticus IMCC3135]|uniref:Uncharacterized protein n=1 Tax=Granulosicoccus antarcticus IMCC3135 TaxID=1192854 RepID=A0A2Z2NLT8_9GAMM|nr:hypothetical protein [Granulosicoccus antarcticus]ASJ70738.1 hypothetical protein IMCC3135_03125 [Granulosicoccus antarcticus IMCC3135]